MKRYYLFITIILMSVSSLYAQYDETKEQISYLNGIHNIKACDCNSSDKTEIRFYKQSAIELYVDSIRKTTGLRHVIYKLLREGDTWTGDFYEARNVRVKVSPITKWNNFDKEFSNIDVSTLNVTVPNHPKLEFGLAMDDAPTYYLEICDKGKLEQYTFLERKLVTKYGYGDDKLGLDAYKTLTKISNTVSSILTIFADDLEY